MDPEAMEVTSSQFSEGGKEYRIAYLLTVCSCRTDGAGTAPVYGVMTELKVDGVPADTACVDDVSPSKETVFDLIHLLARGGVTPVCLRDVAEDFIASR